jgi:hypothetical protein
VAAVPRVSSRRPLIGFLKGTVQLAPGTDLTDPAAPYWGLDLPCFKDSRADREPPRGISLALAALWWAAKGDWNKAHAIAQSDEGADAAWVHAYLHRLEGDLGNARYWYARAGRSPASGPVEIEWDAIVEALLAKAE